MESYNINFEKFEVYRNLPVIKSIEDTFDFYLFFSPSGAANFEESGNHIPDYASVVAIGTTTATACEKLFGREISISEKQTELDAVKFAVGVLQEFEIQHK